MIEKKFTEDFFGLNNSDDVSKEEEKAKTEYTYQIEYIGNGDNNRASAFIKRELLSKDGDKENKLI